MRSLGIICATSLFLVLGFSALVGARQEKEEEKAPKQEQPAKPEKQQEAKAPKQEQQAKPEKQDQAKAPKQEQPAKSDKPQQQHSQQQASGQRQQQAKSSQGPQRTQQAMATQRSQPALRLSARGSGRIPGDRFRSSFGSGHEFRMGNPQLVDGYSRFQYGGYWFGFVDPWPVGWYYTDECYIDYVDGGYYMFNPYYPGARFSISVVI